MNTLYNGSLVLFACFFFSGVVYICTEDVFPSKRLQQMIAAFNEKLGPVLANQLSVGDHIFVEHVAEKVISVHFFWTSTLRLIVIEFINGHCKCTLYSRSDARTSRRAINIFIFRHTLALPW